MTTIYDLAVVARSKNAGPFQITIDLMFPEDDVFQRVLAELSPGRVADVYDLDPGEVAVIPMASIKTIKVTIPRRFGERGSGSPGDTDVYGAQHHGPLGGLTVSDGEGS